MRRNTEASLVLSASRLLPRVCNSPFFWPIYVAGEANKDQMRSTTIYCLAAITGALLLGTACSNNSKVAENSAVESRGDGKGTAPSSAAAKQADRAMVRFVNGTTAKKDVAFGDVMAFDGVGD